MSAALVRTGIASFAGVLGLAVFLPAADVPAPPERPAVAPPAVQIAPERAVSGVTDSERPILFVTDRTAARRLRVAEERIASGRFDEAVELLQGVLDAGEDVTAPTSDAEETFESVKRRALELIGGLPPDGQRIYELKYGVGAKEQLGEALAEGDWGVVEEVARRFFHSEAGREATFRLAVRASDRGEPLQAALMFDLLRSTPGAARRYRAGLSLRSAAAWLATGLKDEARHAAADYLATAGQEPKAGEFATAGVKNADELLARLDAVRGGTPSAESSWAMIGGGVGRTTDVPPVTVAGGAVWSREFNVPNEWDDPREKARAVLLVESLQAVKEGSRGSGRLMQSALHPVAVGDVVVFRTLRNIQAVDVRTGRFLWQTERPHEQLFAKVTGKREEIWPGNFGNGMSLPESFVAQRAWRDVTAGSLTTDGRYVYGVEGTGMTTPFNPYGGAAGAALARQVGVRRYNTLFAYDLAAEGAIAWAAGGPSDAEGLNGVFFLGPPLPLGGLLYGLVEEDGEIRLVALDPAGQPERRFVWSQSLVTAEPAIGNDPVRRLSGVSPAFGEGVLVCPTSAGAVVGVDLGRRLLSWGYQYPRNVPPPPTPGRPPNFGNIPERLGPDDEGERWLDAVPKVADGAVILTPRDSDELHCLSLADGRLRWKRPRGDSLYVADVSGGRVVVVGRRGVEALDLATGEATWKRPVETPLPAGHGVRSGDLYHLPLSTGQILTLRLSTGEELVRSAVGEGVGAGNLIVVGGRLLSQSAEAIAAFRRLDELGQEIQAKLGREGVEKAEALALRGEDRLHRGESASGLEDLKTATGTADLPRARRLLAGVLLEGLRNDFAAYRRYRDDLERLASEPDQRAEYLRLYADGLFAAGESRGAFETYLRLADDDVASKGGERIGPRLIARYDRVLQVRLGELYAASSQDDRRVLDALLARGLAAATRHGREEDLNRFASVIRGTPLAAEALRALAERYEASGDRLKGELAELKLRSVDPKAGGRTVVARPTSPTLDETIARFDVPYRAEYVPDEIKARRPATEVGPASAVRVIGPVPDDYAGWYFEIDGTELLIRGRDPAGVERWTVPLEWDDDGPFLSANAQLRFCGHAAAVVFGTRLVMLDLFSDPAGPRVLWTRVLSDSRFDDVINRQRFVPEPPAGPVGFAGAELLVFQIGTLVTAVDPLSGDPFWHRAGVPGRCEISGDGEFVVLRSPDGAEFLVLRTVDGSDVATRRPEEPPERLLWSGTRLVSGVKTGDGYELRSEDVARGREVWSRKLPKGAVAKPLGAAEVAVLDAAGGRFTVVRAEDGETVFEAAIHPDPAVHQFQPVKTFGRYLLFTHRIEPRGRVQEEMDRSRFPVHGLSYGFDASGERLWSAAIRRQYLSVDQPSGLPVLFLTAKVYRPTGEASHRGVLLDVRTGHFLAEQSREGSLQPHRTTGNVKDRSIEVATTGARFLLSPVEGPLPAAKQQGPESLRDGKEANAAAAIPVDSR